MEYEMPYMPSSDGSSSISISSTSMSPEDMIDLDLEERIKVAHDYAEEFSDLTDTVSTS